MIEWNEFNKTRINISVSVHRGLRCISITCPYQREKIVCRRGFKGTTRAIQSYTRISRICPTAARTEINSMGYEVFSNFVGAADKGFEGNGKGYNFIRNLQYRGFKAAFGIRLK